MHLGGARNLRQVRDRHDLRPLTEAAERLGDRVSSPASDPSIDLVEDDRRLTRSCVRDRAKRERDARQLSARGGLRDRGKWKSRVGPDEEGDAVASAGSRLAGAELGAELAVTHPEALQLVGHRGGERRSSLGAGCGQRVGKLALARLSGGQILVRRFQRVHSRFEGIQLGARFPGAGEQLLVAGGLEATARVRDAFELVLHLLEPARLRLQKPRSEDATSRIRTSASPSSA